MHIREKMKKIAIVGLPNTGKSHMFNDLTGEYTLVGNYSFTTVDIKKGQCRIGMKYYEVIDTPGLHSLYIHSEEELVVRNTLFAEDPDILIQSIDANRLKQSLTLTADLIELGIPMVISVNSVDEAAKKGIRIDAGKLSTLLGIPVIESMSVEGHGTEDLKSAILKAKIVKQGVTYGEIIEDEITALKSIMPGDIKYKRKLAVLMLLDDPFLKDYLKEIYGEAAISPMMEKAKDFRRGLSGRITRIVNRKKNQWVDGISGDVQRKKKVPLAGFSHQFARLSRHPVFGIPILFGILFIIFFAVVNVANVITIWMHDVLWLPIENQINGFIPPGFWNDLLIGDYGILTLGVSNAILTVLPILSIFFILYNALEDMGYIPNLCVLVNRVAGKVGLSGNAIMPVILGFGCKTMATLMTRSLRSKKERYIAIYLIAFALPCAAQMALNMSILGRLGVRAFLIAFGVLAFVEIIAGVILNKILKDEEKYDFIQALPDIRLPNPVAVLKKTYYRLLWFFKEAFPVFIYASIILFTMDKIGILGVLKDISRPVIEGFLGFPIQMVDVLILCMARQEAAAGMIISLIQKGQLNYVQCIVAVILTTMFVPCFANIMAMVKELGTKVAVSMVFIINTTSILLGGALNWVLIKLMF